MACLDLTSLRGDEDEAAIAALCNKAADPCGAPAALCVYPAQVAAARRGLDARGLQQVKVATVVSFPLGVASPEALGDEIAAALRLGADEIDMVLPWRALRAAFDGGMVSRHHERPVPLQGLSAHSAEAACRASVHAARAACGHRPLKVIIESGELKDPGLIQTAARIAVEEGADFVKTSTGKASVHATPDAVAAMLKAMPAHVGLKVAGGVQTLVDVQRYLDLVLAARGADGLTPSRLRFGASSLWPALAASLAGGGASTAAPGAANSY